MEGNVLYSTCTEIEAGSANAPQRYPGPQATRSHRTPLDGMTCDNPDRRCRQLASIRDRDEEREMCASYLLRLVRVGGVVRSSPQCGCHNKDGPTRLRLQKGVVDIAFRQPQIEPVAPTFWLRPGPFRFLCSKPLKQICSSDSFVKCLSDRPRSTITTVTNSIVRRRSNLVSSNFSVSPGPPGSVTSSRVSR